MTTITYTQHTNTNSTLISITTSIKPLRRTYEEFIGTEGQEVIKMVENYNAAKLHYETYYEDATKYTVKFYNEVLQLLDYSKPFFVSGTKLHFTIFLFHIHLKNLLIKI